MERALSQPDGFAEPTHLPELHPSPLKTAILAAAASALPEAIRVERLWAAVGKPDLCVFTTTVCLLEKHGLLEPETAKCTKLTAKGREFMDAEAMNIGTTIERLTGMAPIATVPISGERFTGIPFMVEGRGVDALILVRASMVMTRTLAHLEALKLPSSLALAKEVRNSLDEIKGYCLMHGMMAEFVDAEMRLMSPTGEVAKA